MSMAMVSIPMIAIPQLPGPKGINLARCDDAHGFTVYPGVSAGKSSGWWYTYPSENWWSSSVGMIFHSQLNGKSCKIPWFQSPPARVYNYYKPQKRDLVPFSLTPWPRLVLMQPWEVDGTAEKSSEKYTVELVFVWGNPWSVIYVNGNLMVYPLSGHFKKRCLCHFRLPRDTNPGRGLHHLSDLGWWKSR